MKSNRREMIQAAALLAPFALPAGAATALGNMVVSPSKAKHSVQDFGEVTNYFNGSTGQLSSLASGCFRLKPGGAPHPPHSHPEEEILLITEGTGELSIEGAKTQVAPGEYDVLRGGPYARDFEHGHNADDVLLLEVETLNRF